jgi:hypothetical protein
MLLINIIKYKEKEIPQIKTWKKKNYKFLLFFKLIIIMIVKDDKKI